MKNDRGAQNPVKTQNKSTVYYAIFFTVVCGLTIIAHLYFFKTKLHAKDSESMKNSDCPSSLTIIRGNDKELINRLYLADVEIESPKYSELKEDLSRLILQHTGRGIVQSVSVYFRDLNRGSWMSIDGDRGYMVGSLMKVPIMIYYLLMERDHPGTLKKELIYVKPKHQFPSQEFKGDSILSGQRYKISELLRYMIVESDNNATILLSRDIDPEIFRKIFTDLIIPPDEINDIDYQISPKQYSKFFRVLYNATYLTRKLSEYALQLLTQCKFNHGISRDLPPGIIIARKFGELGRNEVMDFSECAIVYRGNEPYLLMIMTKGTNVKEQTDLVSEISDMVYHFQDKD